MLVRLDGQTDGVLGVCQLCIPCTRNREQALILKTSTRILDTLEPELVPTIIQVEINSYNI
jgi:hypothetical protein